MLINPDHALNMQLYCSAAVITAGSTVTINGHDYIVDADQLQIDVYTGECFESFDDYNDALYCVASNTYGATLCVRVTENLNYSDGLFDVLIHSREPITFN